MKKELIAVVDENDVVISTKSRDELLATDIIRVSVLWIEDGKGNVLLQQRSLNKKLGPGQWGPAAAGTVEKNETYLTNILKEAEEEIGLVNFSPDEVGKILFWEPDGKFGRMFTFFRSIVNKPISDFHIQEEEVAQLKWVSKNKLLNSVAQDANSYVPSATLWKQIYYQ